MGLFQTLIISEGGDGLEETLRMVAAVDGAVELKLVVGYQF